MSISHKNQPSLASNLFESAVEHELKNKTPENSGAVFILATLIVVAVIRRRIAPHSLVQGWR